MSLESKMNELKEKYANKERELIRELWWDVDSGSGRFSTEGPVSFPALIKSTL